MLRFREGEQRVTRVELFFDLIFDFAITQLSALLIFHISSVSEAPWRAFGSPPARGGAWRVCVRMEHVRATVPPRRSPGRKRGAFVFAWNTFAPPSRPAGVRGASVARLCSHGTRSRHPPAPPGPKPERGGRAWSLTPWAARGGWCLRQRLARA
jgi:hypothetical protein